MIQVFYTDISQADPLTAQRLYTKASPQRKKRAEGYKDPQDALRCLTAEALLRFALGSDCFHEEKTPDGKPFLPEHPEFCFNLSHSGKWVAIAFGGSEVGVDVERIRENTAIDAIAGRFFSQQEQRYIHEAPDESRRRFFEVWTAKESYVKFLGSGLSRLAQADIYGSGPDVGFFHRTLDGGYCLCVCTREADVQWEAVAVSRLL